MRFDPANPCRYRLPRTNSSSQTPESPSLETAKTLARGVVLATRLRRVLLALELPDESMAVLVADLNDMLLACNDERRFFRDDSTRE
jgi:hypothetical protein